MSHTNLLIRINITTISNNMREEMRKNAEPTEWPLRLCVVEFMNLLLSENKEAKALHRTLQEKLIEKFDISISLLFLRPK